MVKRKVVKKKVAKKSKDVSMFQKLASGPSKEKYFSAYNVTNTKKLSALGVNDIIAYDELGTEFSEWTSKNKLVLAVLPLCDAFTLDKTKSKVISGTKIPLTKEHLKCTFALGDSYRSKEIFENVVYIKKQNMLVATVNPFVNTETFNHILNAIRVLKPKVITEKDLLAIELTELATKHIDDKKEHLNTSIAKRRGSILTLENDHRKSLALIRNEIKERALLGQEDNVEAVRISKEVKAIMDMPVVKKVFIKEGIIHINFGQISVVGNIKDGTTKKGGVVVPNIKKEKVNLGELEFTIGNGSVKCLNLTHKENNPHPHASDSGSCCFGGSSEDLNKLIVSFKLVELAKMLYAWALSYNEAGGPHKHLQFFYERAKK